MILEVLCLGQCWDVVEDYVQLIFHSGSFSGPDIDLFLRYFNLKTQIHVNHEINENKDEG